MQARIQLAVLQTLTIEIVTGNGTRALLLFILIKDIIPTSDEQKKRDSAYSPHPLEMLYWPPLPLTNVAMKGN